MREVIVSILFTTVENCPEVCKRSLVSLMSETAVVIGAFEIRYCLSEHILVFVILVIRGHLHTADLSSAAASSPAASSSPIAAASATLFLVIILLFTIVSIGGVSWRIIVVSVAVARWGHLDSVSDHDIDLWLAIVAATACTVGTVC